VALSDGLGAWGQTSVPRKGTPADTPAEVAKSVENITAVTQQATASTQQIAKLARDLQELVGQFKTENGQVKSAVAAAVEPVGATSSE